MKSGEVYVWELSFGRSELGAMRTMQGEVQGWEGLGLLGDPYKVLM